jgi:S-formylglutathione hydrolase FrmB
MDSLIRTGDVGEMIVVMPNARNAFDGSFYTNSPVTGNWEQFIVRDLVNYVDRKYRTLRSGLASSIS